jgi:hypothetical protein
MVIRRQFLSRNTHKEIWLLTVHLVTVSDAANRGGETIGLQQKSNIAMQVRTGNPTDGRIDKDNG